MEYKIFGPRGTPDSDMRTQLAEFSKLDETQRKAIASVFLNDEFDSFYSSQTPEVLIASSMLPEQFNAAIALIRSLLYSWREYNLQIADIERDLLLLGSSESEIRTLIDFLNSLESVKDRVWGNNYNRIQQLDGLPTIDNVNFICDARAIFGGFPDGAHHPNKSYKTFLGLIPIVIIEVISSDNYGQRQRTAFQMSERQFGLFRGIINEAQEQLAILKEQIKDSALRE